MYKTDHVILFIDKLTDAFLRPLDLAMLIKSVANVIIGIGPHSGCKAHNPARPLLT